MFVEARMSNQSDVVGRLEERLSELRTVLGLLESGRLITREWICGESWRPTTSREIERTRQDIAKYERMIAQVRAWRSAA